MSEGAEDQKTRLHDVIEAVADLALEADDLQPNLRLKVRTIRLIYAGHELALKEVSGKTAWTVVAG